MDRQKDGQPDNYTDRYHLKTEDKYSREDNIFIMFFLFLYRTSIFIFRPHSRWDKVQQTQSTKKTIYLVVQTSHHQQGDCISEESHLEMRDRTSYNKNRINVIRSESGKNCICKKWRRAETDHSDNGHHPLSEQAAVMLRPHWHLVAPTGTWWSNLGTGCKGDVQRPSLHFSCVLDICFWSASLWLIWADVLNSLIEAKKSW